MATRIGDIVLVWGELSRWRAWRRGGRRRGEARRFEILFTPTCRSLLEPSESRTKT